MPDHTPWLAIKATRGRSSRSWSWAAADRPGPRGRFDGQTGRRRVGAAGRRRARLTETLTDDDGRFALPGVLAEPAFVFVAKSAIGFRARRSADDPTVEVVLARMTSLFPAADQPCPHRWPRAEELASSIGSSTLMTERAIKEGTPTRVVRGPAHADRARPARAIELLGDERLDAWQPDSLRLTWRSTWSARIMTRRAT